MEKILYESSQIYVFINGDTVLTNVISYVIIQYVQTTEP